MESLYRATCWRMSLINKFHVVIMNNKYVFMIRLRQMIVIMFGWNVRCSWQRDRLGASSSPTSMPIFVQINELRAIQNAKEHLIKAQQSDSITYHVASCRDSWYHFRSFICYCYYRWPEKGVDVIFITSSARPYRSPCIMEIVVRLFVSVIYLQSIRLWNRARMRPHKTRTTRHAHRK